MQQITVELQQSTAQKFNKYVKLFGNKNIMFNKFVDFQINNLKREIVRMQLVLEKYEKKHKIKSNEFYKQFEDGKFDDEKDYMIWSGIYELQLDSKNKLKEYYDK